MFTESNNPSELCAVVETTTRKRAATGATRTIRNSRRAPIANEQANKPSQPSPAQPLASNPIADCLDVTSTHTHGAVGNLIPDAARISKEPIEWVPHQELQSTLATVEQQPIFHPPEWSSGHVSLAPYSPTPATQENVAEIVTLHRLRQGMIKAQTKLKLQGMASIRFATMTDDDFASDEAKAKARKRNEDLYRVIVSDPAHPMHVNIAPYLMAMEPLDAQRAVYEKAMVKAVKRLPVYEWVKDVKGFGDISFATIVGECGDIGSYKSVSAVWKRLGLAVMSGNRQGAPGEGATKDDWIAHGYNKQRRSVSYVAREHVIGGMGKWRPAFGEDVWANPELTYYQKVYADRARFEAEKLGLPVTVSNKGKESYKKHVSMRAHRYVEKRLLRNLWIEWRRHPAQAE
ncbi:hypothetical protein LB533_20620 [Mesorhizobium sp. BR1-1-13]|uniref:hypothetical protein n=1 Tax=Mesorhizobium sp. BR1-1-13 TaxID=2876656 RepID=UPI001CD154CC|nr:hypothetical protein [Mesorhizobium sp. BR1-1-13]MBZ9943494.1 hypothetical protein [Mesorhizobium sp. BR1-1-13]